MKSNITHFLKTNFQSILRYFIAVIFIFSGLTKFIDIQKFNQLFLENYINIGWIGNIVSVLIPPIEIGIGVILIINKEKKWLYILLINIMLIFTFIILKSYLNNDNFDCGCFGSIIKVSPVFSILKNVIIIIICFYLFLKYQNKPTAISPYFWICFIIFCYINDYNLSRQNRYNTSKNGFNPTDIKNDNNPIKNLVGTSVININLDDLIHLPKNKKIGLFFYSPSCSHCWNASWNIKDLIDKKTVDTIIGISVNGYEKDTLAYNQYFKPQYKTIFIPYKELEKYTNAFPIFVYIQNDTIKKYFNSYNIPCAEILNKSVINL